MLLLADLSNNNPEPVEFHRMRAHGVFGVWLKVTEGEKFVDPTWRWRSSHARSAGLRVGGYHFARPGAGTAEAQARAFVKQLGRVQRRDLRPVLDLEVYDKHLAPGALHDWAVLFLTTVRNLTGVKCLTYSSPGYIIPQGWSRTFGVGAGLWLAAYGPDDGREHPVDTPAPWKRRVAHQFTSRGRIPGVSGDVDLSHAPSRRRILAHPLAGLV